MQPQPTPAARWSTPYFGVSHLEGLRDGFRVYVQDYAVFAETAVATPVSGFNPDKAQFPTVEAAKVHAEAQARLLSAFAVVA